ncbi:MAG: 4Fe-4S dicluster domain-containing protein [Nitrososphaerota archaeon]|nr:4Fe-4S dicluster domain-containing protein [Nitrososphaerales archaeon]MDW8045490.1 4Fe-4S dicluster domain-containing protein [Nitrososphaerota archaeon]
MNNLQAELERMAKELGVDLIGFADLTTVQDFICKQGGEYLRKFPRGVSIGIRLLDAIVDELYRHEDRSVIFTYKALYNTINSRLDHITLLLAKKIQENGYHAYPIPASQRIDHSKLIGVISHKLVANLSGLGWIGKSCLLVTPWYGPRVRLATILTDAPFKTGSPINGRCGNCEECVKICPVKAFTGVPFDPSEPVEVRFNVHLCDEYMRERERRLGERLCGLCVYICPYGRSSKKLT